jgi:hypothetical protein
MVKLKIERNLGIPHAQLCVDASLALLYALKVTQPQPLLQKISGAENKQAIVVDQPNIIQK